MKDKFPEIYKNKIEKVKSKVQTDFYYHADERKADENKITTDKKVDKVTLMKKINNIFLRPDYVYQADVNIMYKNGESINKKIIGIKDNYLIAFDGEKIYINDILDVK